MILLAFAFGVLMGAIASEALSRKDKLENHFSEGAIMDKYHRGILPLEIARCQRWHNNAFDFHFEQKETI